LKAGALLGACSGQSSSVSPDITSVNKPGADLKPTIGNFGIHAYPNPSTSQFTVQVQSDNARDKIMVRVYDLNGHVQDGFTNLAAQQLIRFGANYVPGIYIIEMTQGAQRKQLKLVKEAQ
jgi:hypothetical protein